MNLSTTRSLALAAFALVGLAAGCKGGDSDSTSSAASNSAHKSAAGGQYAAVQAIFTENCISCHGDQHPKGGIALTNYDNVMKGGKDGPIVVAGDPDNSVVAQALRGTHDKMQMPARKPPLAEEKIKAVEAWIKSGAKQDG